MRYREDFSLYRRRLPSGKSVFYYQTYDENGKRTPGRSTGQTTKTTARAYCNGLLKDGKLRPSEQVKAPTFAEYAKGWWEYDTCPYLQQRKKRRKMRRKSRAPTPARTRTVWRNTWFRSLRRYGLTASQRRMWRVGLAASRRKV